MSNRLFDCYGTLGFIYVFSRNSELDLLGNTELVLSNHEDVVSADCIEGP